MRFAAPEYLLLLWVLLALAAVRLIARVRRRRRARAFAAASPYVRLVPGLSGSRRGFRDILRFGAATALVLALARPQFGQRLAVVVREGIDVIVAIDTSASMMAEDLKPNRLETAKRAVIGLSERLRGDRFGIVVFSGSAFVQCPLTVDAKAVRLLVDAIGPETVPDPGTALGAAIDRATSAFPHDEPRFKALVLITDGEETAGDPLAAARRAAEKGVRIFTVGLGAPRGEPIPVRNPDGAIVGYKKDRQGEVVLSRLDETMLERLADLGDGRYFRASPALNELDALYAEIDAMEKREIRGGFHAHYEDRFHWFAVASSVLLAFARLVGEKTNLPRPALTSFLLLLVLAAPAAIADVGDEVHQGNRAYQRGEPETAAEHYLRALSEDPDRPEVLYNLGNALYLGQHFVDAEAAYGTAAAGADSSLVAPLTYNLGNALFRQERYAEAADAYKKRLRQDPGDEDARWNLELALRKLKEQEQQQQQQEQQQQDDDQQQGDDDQLENDQQQEGDQDREDQEQENQDSGGEEEDRGGQSDQGEKESESSPEEREGEVEQDDEQTMSAEEAARLLEALGNEEQELLRERFRSRGRRVDVEKDW